MALLLEYYNGQLPGWLAPVQIYTMPVDESSLAQSQSIASALMSKELRVFVDHNQGSLSKRILFAHKIRPFAKVIVGQKELEGGQHEIQFRDRKQKCLVEEIGDIIQKSVVIPG